MVEHQSTHNALQALQRLNQRRSCASLQLEEVIDRAIGICSRASAIQRKVLKQNQSFGTQPYRQMPMPNWATAAAV